MKQRLCKQCGTKYKPKYPKQEDCSELCLANRFDKFVKKSRKLAKILAGTMGYRSMSEVRFAVELNSHTIPYKYESRMLRYQYAPQKYTVDFTLTKKDGSEIQIEYKGKLDAATRKKLRAIKKSNPTVDLRLVFEKPNNKIYKGAKLRYGDWAERNGFKWYDCRDITGIKSDLGII